MPYNGCWVTGADFVDEIYETIEFNKPCGFYIDKKLVEEFVVKLIKSQAPYVKATCHEIKPPRSTYQGKARRVGNKIVQRKKSNG